MASLTRDDSKQHIEAEYLWLDYAKRVLEDKTKTEDYTDGEAVIKPPLSDLFAPCSHEEADGRMLLQASHATQHGHHKIMIRTVDTDVVMLAVSVAQ